jgi:hypothetical protein
MLTFIQKLSEGLSSLKKHTGGAVQCLIFFALFYLYLWLYVDLRLIYHGAGIITNFPTFYKGWAFFQTFIPYPGGPLEYLCAFLSQLFYYSWAGAFVITIQAWLIWTCLNYLLEAINAPQLRLLIFTPPILILILYTRYTYQFETTMAFSAALTFVSIYLKINKTVTSNYGSLAFFLILSPVLYYLAGGAFIPFAVICAIYELFFKRRWKTGLLCLLSAAVIPYIVGLVLFQESATNAFSELLPFSWKILYNESRKRGLTIAYLIYLFPLLILLGSGLRQTFGKLRNFAGNESGIQENESHIKKLQSKTCNAMGRIFSRYRHSPNLKWTIDSLLLLTIACCITYSFRDENIRTRFKVDYYAYHKKWAKLLTAARRNPTNPLVIHAVNRALYHTGRLGYDMFSWPQRSDYLFLQETSYKWADWQTFDINIDIGLFNLAENDLTECLERLGDRPMILQRLALINMVKGNIDSARTYLHSLNKTLFHDKWAKHYLMLLQTDPNLSSDKYIQHLRSLSLNKDYPTLSIPTQRLLSLLLEKNSQNQMAFEYLMAWYMLKKQLGNFIQNIERLRDFGYLQLPTHYEEASLVYVYGTRKPLNLSGYQPSPQLRQHIEDFSRLLDKYGANKQAAFKELSTNFRNTYFFYYIYAPSEK